MQRNLSKRTFAPFARYLSHSNTNAHNLFDGSPHLKILPVNQSMLEFLHAHRPNQALNLFKDHLRLGFSHHVDEATVALALKACNGDYSHGIQIHAFAVSSGFISFTKVSNSLMNMYCKSGNFDLGLCVFENLDHPDVVSWNTLISGCCESGVALSLACRMNASGFGFDAVSYTTLLSYCLDFEGFLFGLQLQGLIVKSGLDSEVFIGNALVTLYARQELLVDARKVFESIPNKDLVSWNSLISGYTQEGNFGLEAICLFIEMARIGMRLDHVSFTSVVSACGHERNLEVGRQVHGLALKAGYGKHVSVGNVLMSTYLKSHAIEDAKFVFRKMSERNVISWTTMISVADDALYLFNQMRLDGVCPNDVTLIGLLHWITSENLVREGESVHAFCIKTGFTLESNISNCLITMYAEFGSMESSSKIFKGINYREIISWNAMISGYTHNGQWLEALETFSLATTELHPNEYTFGSVLSAIADAEAISLRHGERCHSYLVKLGLNADPVVSGALLDMYAKRGSIFESLKVFNEIPLRSQFAWTAIISAHARHGDSESVMNLFKEMENEGIQPDSITFLSVLTACGRNGMVDMGRELFNMMIHKYMIEPSHEHYSCMVDMLGRVGLLTEAEELLNSIPGGPGLSVLQSLLGSCRVHGDVEMAERITTVLMEMEPLESGSYVLMSNLYAEKGQWEKAAKIRKWMREKGVKKEIGFSWVDVGDMDGSLVLHGFSSGDVSHPRSEEIHNMIEYLGLEMQFLRETKRHREAERLQEGISLVI